MENTINERVKTILEEKNLSVNAFALALDMPQVTVNNYVKGNRKISFELIERIAKVYPDISKQWLLTGEGSMLLDGSPPPDIQLLTSNVVPSEPVDIEYAGENKNAGVFFRDKNTGQLYISVPHMPYAARGEFPNLADSLEPLSEWGREVYAVDRKANGRYISFDVRGDSMDNGMRRSLQNGDKVLVRELEHDNWRTLRTGDHRYWVLVFGTSVLIKEISSFDPATGLITCHSLNPSPEYHDFTLSLDEVRYLYYVIKIKPVEISWT